MKIKQGGRHDNFTIPSITAPEEHNPVPPMLYVSEKSVWEYKRLSRSLKQTTPPSEEELNDYGKEGWELVGNFIYADTLYLYFKRETR